MTITYDYFKSSECDKIVELGDSLLLEASTVDHKVDKDIRYSKQAWINPTENNLWLFDRVSQLFGGTTSNILQFPQYTVYESGGHYIWHRDVSFSNNSQAMTAVVSLNDYSEYTGGFLEVKTDSDEDTFVRTKGLVTIFPAERLHRVTPVESGIRKTLVVWGLL